MLTPLTITLAAVTLGILAIAMAWILGWANRAFYVEVDPRVEAIMNALPGANCGGCGYVGCSEYAEAVAAGKAPVDICPPGGTSAALAMARIMGVEVGQMLPYRAVVHCTATTEQRLKRTPYRGEQTCAGANLVAGVQGCTYGCLGLGDCVRACPYDAIHIIDGVARVDYKYCIGCKLCARACPRNIISMVPFKAERVMVVGCSNKDFGPVVKEVCKVGCIGCKACTRVTDLFKMEGNLPVLDYDRYDPAAADMQPAIDKCPMESLVFVGRPTEADLAAVAAEDLPDRVESDFKTSVDETEWRG